MDIHEIISNEILPKIKQPIWDSWYIKECIGSGSFSSVYRIEAARTTMIDEAALKISILTADRDFATEDEKFNYFEQKRKSIDSESIIMKQLKDCPYIVNYYDEKVDPFYIQDVFKGYYFLIRMELLTPLTAYKREKNFSYNEDNVLKLASNIGEALQYAHAHNILHRDVKPDNLYVSGDQIYKLGDFTISGHSDTAHSSAESTGYIAPEIFHCKTDPAESYTKQADIYSFGICLYQMMNDGRFPLESQNISADDAIAKRLNHEPFPCPKNASSDFGRIINKACAFHCQDRYQSMDEMLQDLHSIPRKLQSGQQHSNSGQPMNAGSTGQTGDIGSPLPKNTRDHTTKSGNKDEPRRSNETPTSHGKTNTPPPDPKRRKKIIGAILAGVGCVALVGAIGYAMSHKLTETIDDSTPEKIEDITPEMFEDAMAEPISRGFADPGTSEYAVLYDSMEKDSRELAHLYGGEPLEIFALYGEWYQVKYGDINGYIHAVNISFTDPAETPATASTSVSTEKLPPGKVNTQSGGDIADITFHSEIPATATNPRSTVTYDGNGIAIPNSHPTYSIYPTPQIGYVIVDHTNVYKDASTSSPRGEADKQYRNNAVEIYGLCGDFYYISADSGSGYNIFGYIPAKNIVIGIPPGLPDAYYTAKNGYVSVQSCNVRSSPSKANSDNIIDTLYNGTIFTINSFNGYWYNITYSGRTGYISHKMITPGASPAEITPTSGFVEVDECNVRCSPSKENDKNIIDTLPMGTAFTATHFDGSWYYITYAGGSGYVSKNVVSVSSERENNVTVYRCEKLGEINGTGVAGFTTSYVCENGPKTIVYEDLGNHWHFISFNYCYSKGIEWYELYDADDGDYYGWVDANYLRFY